MIELKKNKKWQSQRETTNDRVKNKQEMTKSKRDNKWQSQKKTTRNDRVKER
jgi:hypothetical protein